MKKSYKATCNSDQECNDNNHLICSLTYPIEKNGPNVVSMSECKCDGTRRWHDNSCSK